MGLVDWVMQRTRGTGAGAPVPVRGGEPDASATDPEPLVSAACADEADRPSADAASEAGSGVPAGPRPQSTDRDGTVSVRDGRVHVRRPRGGGRWPSVEPGASIEGHPAELRINGRPLAGRRVVRETDRVELCNGERVVPGGIDVEISPDGLRAWVTVHPPVHHEVRLADARSALQLRLEMYLCDTRLSPEVTEADVLASVERSGVSVPLRDGALTRALDNPGERVLVAEGMAAGHGQPTTIWNCFERQFHVWHGPSDRNAALAGLADTPPDGRPPVEMGETLIVLRPGRPGRSGYTVSGEVLSDDGALPLRLAAGPGAMLSKDGLTAIAAQAGSVAVTAGPDWIGVAVYEQRCVEGNVAANSRFHVRGNLCVGGSVEPNCDIFAEGRVAVGGDVIRARIEAGGGIEVAGGVSNGLLLAGGAALIYAELFADCESFIEAGVGLERAVGAETAAWGEWSDWGDDGWTPRLRRLGFRIASDLQKADLECDPVVVEFGRALSEAMARRRVVRLDVAGGALRELLRQAEAAVACMRTALALPADCRVGHLDYARLEVTGDVAVTGSGCYRSHIKAGGSVQVAGRFRSGSVVCGRDATFEEIGSPGEAVTRVVLPADGRFTARLVHPGTVVRIGAHSRVFELPVRNAVLGHDATGATAALNRAPVALSGVRAERAAV